MQTFSLFLPGRPLTQNRLRSSHWRVAQRDTKCWREAAEAEFSRLYPIEAVEGQAHVVAQPVSKTRRLADVGACFPTVKAVLDGAVDSGLLDNDGPDRIISLTMLVPCYIMGTNGLFLVITSSGDPMERFREEFLKGLRTQSQQPEEVTNG